MSANKVKNEVSGYEIAQVVVKKASPADLNNASGTGIKVGQPFWVRSQETDKFDNAPCILTYESDKEEIKYWLDQGMLYVPVPYGELIDGDVATEINK